MITKLSLLADPAEFSPCISELTPSNWTVVVRCYFKDLSHGNMCTLYLDFVSISWGREVPLSKCTIQIIPYCHVTLSSNVLSRDEICSCLSMFKLIFTVHFCWKMITTGFNLKTKEWPRCPGAVSYHSADSWGHDNWQTSRRHADVLDGSFCPLVHSGNVSIRGASEHRGAVSDQQHHHWWAHCQQVNVYYFLVCMRETLTPFTGLRACGELYVCVWVRERLHASVSFISKQN